MTHETLSVASKIDLLDNASDTTGIRAFLVPDNRRLDFLPLHFGERLMIQFETSVYGWMNNLCADYHGGYWNYIELTNGGAFMMPTGVEAFEIKVEGNGFHRNVSAELAGIISTAFALNGMLWQGYGSLAAKYEQLQAFIAYHPESATIRRALD